jgi:hypothetical protein
MIDILGGLAMRVLQFYAWTVGLGLVVLAVIMLAEGTVDLIRDRRAWRTSRSSTPG